MKLKRIALKTLWVVFSILVGLVLWVFLRWHEKPTISVDYVAKFNEMRKPADYRPEDDGFELFLRACQLMEEQYERDEAMPHVFRWVPLVKDGRMTDYRRFNLQWPGDMNDTEVVQMKDWLTRSADVMKLADEAMAKKCFWAKRYVKGGHLAGLTTPDLVESKDVYRAIIWRGKFMAWQGDVNGGLADIIFAGNTLRYVGDKPTLVEWLCGMNAAKESSFQAIEALRRIKASSKDLANMAKQIEMVANRWNSIEIPMTVERLFFLEYVQELFSDNGHGDGRILPGTFYRWSSGSGLASRLEFDTLVATLNVWSGTESRRATIERYDMLMAESLKLAEMEPWQLRAGDNPWDRLKKLTARNEFLKIFWSSMERVVAELHEYRNNTSGVLATIAVLRYKADSGRLPEKWDELVEKKYIRESPRDSYSGRPLIYKKMADDFTVYSVGKNGADDGGDRTKDAVFWPVETHDNDPEWAVAIVELLRYVDEIGELPAGWDDLRSKGLIPEIPLDIFGGKPLILKKTPETFMVYGVGPDGNDDGGDAEKDVVFLAPKPIPASIEY